MVAKTSDGNDLHIRTDAAKLLAEDRHIDLHMVFHCIGVIAPDPGQDQLLAEDPLPVLHQQPHHVKFPGAEPDGLLPADQQTGGEVEPRVAKAQLVHLAALAAQEGIDAAVRGRCLYS